MGRRASEYPTELELEILKVLWDGSPPLPVRDIRQALAAMGRDLAHTTVITTLNIMARKKYVRRTRDGVSFLFAPRVTHEQVSRKMLGDLVHRVFDGSAAAVVLSLLNTADIDSDELRDLRRLINRMAKEQN